MNCMLRKLSALILFSILTSVSFGQYQQNQLRYPGDSLGLTIRGGSSINWGWEYNDQKHAVSVSPSGNRNTYFAWSERGEFDWRIRGAAVDSSGNLLWIRTINDHTNHQDYPTVQALSDGCIVAWVDYRDGVLRSIYAQKILANGNTLWPTIGDTTEGLLIAEANDYRMNLRMISDGGDGAILVWEDNRRGFSTDLWGTRILGNGQTAPGFRANGTPIAVAAASQPYNGYYSICTDGRGGVWVTWVDSRSSGDPNLFLQRLRSNGTLQFDSTGQILIDAVGEQSHIEICPDGRNGAFLVWRNFTPGEQDHELYMQRIDSSGTPRWNPGATGVPLTNIVGDQIRPKIISAGVDTCIVAWEDFRNDPIANSNDDIYCNKVTGTTTLQKLWGVNGTAVCVELHQQRESQISSDGNRGVIIAWEDEREDFSPMQDIFAQRIDASGQPLWDVNGRPVANATGGQYQVIPKFAGNDRFLFLWQDSRNGSEPIYRTLWSGTGQPIENFPANGILTIPDISYNCMNISVLSNETDRFFTTWVDGRWQPFGSRVYYSINNAVTGAPIGCAHDGNPVTLDTNNYVSQQGGQQLSSPLLVTTPDQDAIVIYTQTALEVRTLRSQKISRNGERMWGNFGTQISPPLYNIDNLSGVPDGNSGALFCYTAVDTTSPYFYNQVQVQHVSASGQPMLNPAGVVIDSSDREQSFSCLTKSGENYYVGYIQLDDENNLYYS
ncbi:MAG: hypothetical protein OEM52_11190, partial [bacterium]|nr:hypothetical protein [bacterium]